MRPQLAVMWCRISATSRAAALRAECAALGAPGQGASCRSSAQSRAAGWDWGQPKMLNGMGAHVTTSAIPQPHGKHHLVADVFAVESLPCRAVHLAHSSRVTPSKRLNTGTDPHALCRSECPPCRWVGAVCILPCPGCSRDGAEWGSSMQPPGQVAGLLPWAAFSRSSL